MRIAETIDAFYGDAGAKDGVSRSYKQAVEDLDAETIKALDGPYRYVRSSFGSAYLTHTVRLFWSPFRDSVPTFQTSTNVRTSTSATSQSNKPRYQEAEPQTPRLRCNACKGQEARRETRQGRY